MRSVVTALAAASAIALCATAANATIVTIITPTSHPKGTAFLVSGDPFTGTDALSAELGHTGIASGSFEDIYRFTIGTAGQGTIGFGSGSLSTSIAIARALNGVTDVNFTKVLVNGFAATIYLADIHGNACSTRGVGTCGAFEFAAISDVPITGGHLNEIDVFGTVGGKRGKAGSYGGNATFAPLPEPATWAMMLLGFGVVGWTRRRTRRAQPSYEIA